MRPPLLLLSGAGNQLQHVSCQAMPATASAGVHNICCAKQHRCSFRVTVRDKQYGQIVSARCVTPSPVVSVQTFEQPGAECPHGRPGDPPLCEEAERRCIAELALSKGGPLPSYDPAALRALLALGHRGSAASALRDLLAACQVLTRCMHLLHSPPVLLSNASHL